MPGYRGPQRSAAGLGVACATAALALAACGPGPQRSTDSAAAGIGYRPLVRPTERLEIEAGETLDVFLARGGVSTADIRRLLDVIRPYADWMAPHEAVEARFHRWPGEAPERIELKVDRDLTLDMSVEGAHWEVTVDSVVATLDTVVVSGALRSSLYSAALAGDADALSTREKAALPGLLADVYAWQIDFYRDPRPGDAFRVALVRETRPDGSLRRSTVIAAEYANRGRLHQAYRFAPLEGASALYVDDQGTSLRGAFLRAPLDLVRVTSRFASDRYHPVLGSYRSHEGVDYGAPAGTPVRATGDGRVVRAGWAGDFGLLVEVEHGSGIRTRYAHLGGIADEVHVGGSVLQGEVIGAVGSTGLSTAPHLHYEFRQRGRALDPSSVDIPVERPIAEAEAGRFAEARSAARAVLGRSRWPGGVPAWRHGAADSP